MSTELETNDMAVVTLPVPTSDPRELAVTVVGRTVHVAGPGGFSREVVLSQAADLERLHADLFHGFLALRAPRDDCRVPQRAALSVPVREIA